MEAGALSALVATALARAWRADSTLHGDEHWRCVAATGLALAAWVAGADRILVFCFGLLHDTRRLTDGADPEHGTRAAAFAEELQREGFLTLDDVRLAVLADALVHHSGGLVSDDPTTGVCWDADRLHLPRVSITPRGELLSTRAARGEAPVAAAALLRSNGPPSWDVLVEAAVRPRLCGAVSRRLSLDTNPAQTRDACAGRLTPWPSRTAAKRHPGATQVRGRGRTRKTGPPASTPARRTAGSHCPWAGRRRDRRSRSWSRPFGPPVAWSAGRRSTTRATRPRCAGF